MKSESDLAATEARLHACVLPGPTPAAAAQTLAAARAAWTQPVAEPLLLAWRPCLLRLAAAAIVVACGLLANQLLIAPCRPQAVPAAVTNVASAVPGDPDASFGPRVLPAIATRLDAGELARQWRERQALIQQVPQTVVPAPFDHQTGLDPAPQPALARYPVRPLSEGVRA